MEKAMAIAYRYLSFRPRTVAETVKYLQKKSSKYSFSQGEIDAVIELLKDQGFLDDLAFIKSFISSRATLKPKGTRMLMMELKKLGISAVDLDAYFTENSVDDNEQALVALKKRMKILLLIPDEKKRFIKAVSFLQRRGFSYDVARRVYLQLTRQ